MSTLLLEDPEVSVAGHRSVEGKALGGCKAVLALWDDGVTRAIMMVGEFPCLVVLFPAVTMVE